MCTAIRSIFYRFFSRNTPYRARPPRQFLVYKLVYKSVSPIFLFYRPEFSTVCLHTFRSFYSPISRHTYDGCRTQFEKNLSSSWSSSWSWSSWGPWGYICLYRLYIYIYRSSAGSHLRKNAPSGDGGGLRPTRHMPLRVMEAAGDPRCARPAGLLAYAPSGDEDSLEPTLSAAITPQTRPKYVKIR